MSLSLILDVVDLTDGELHLNHNSLNILFKQQRMLRHMPLSKAHLHL